MMPDRRRFLRQAALVAAGATLPRALVAEAQAAQVARPAPLPPAAAVRIRGRVGAASRGLRGVAVTDGVSIVNTDAEGRFELVSTTRQSFVYLSLPAGYATPVTPTGTARMYRPIRPDAAGTLEVAFDLVPRRVPDERHDFFVLADPQTETAEETRWFHEQTVPDVRAEVRSREDLPMFGVGCGDLMFDDLALFPEYERAVREMGVPFFQVVGNHDLDPGPTDEASVATFERLFGPTYYSFNIGAVHYVVLDDVLWYGSDYLGYVDARQLAWLEADLARVERGRLVIVFLHIPLLSGRFRRNAQPQPTLAYSVANRQVLYRLLEPYRAHLLAGHTHESEHGFESGVHEHIHGTVCGAWWSGPICYDGTPSGYGIYEVRGEEVRWQYKATGSPVAHQMRLYAHGADPTAPDEIVANVWDWDPEWRVVWYEDGERKGAMARRVGLDPLSVSLHRGPDLPARRRWVEPVRTDHLFYAPASRRAREIRVEATDRWGRTYSEALRPASNV